jgi:hypothetical protein
MRHSLLIFYVLLLNGQLAQAQTLEGSNSDSIQTLKAERVNNAFYIELGGTAGLYSVNYERRLSNQFWSRIGASYIQNFISNEVFIDKFLGILLSVSWLAGGDTSFFELGLGTMVAYAEGSTFFNDDENKEFGAIFNATIGHRLQPPDKSFFFKIAFTPLFSPSEGRFLPSGGLSFGYSF